MITISDKAKAIAALNMELDVLFHKSLEYSNKFKELHYRHMIEVKNLSDLHKQTLNKIIALEDAIAKIMEK